MITSLLLCRQRQWGHAKTLMQSIIKKSIKGINTKLGILADHDKVQLQGKEHNSESYILELCPFLSKNLSRIPDRRVLVQHTMLLFLISDNN